MSKEFKQTLRDHCMAKVALHAPLFMAFSNYVVFDEVHRCAYSMSAPSPIHPGKMTRLAHRDHLLVQ